MAHLKMRLRRGRGLWRSLSAWRAPQRTRSNHEFNAWPTGTQEIDTIVAAWARNSSQIKTLTAQFSRTGKGLGYGTIEYQYLLKWKQSGQAVLETVQVMRNNKVQEFERVVWTGKEIWLFHPTRKR